MIDINIYKMKNSESKIYFYYPDLLIVHALIYTTFFILSNNHYNIYKHKVTKLSFNTRK